MVAEWAVDKKPDERRALEWLEEQPPPSISASEVDWRSVQDHYVPTNDTATVSTRKYEKKYEVIGNFRKILEEKGDNTIALTRIREETDVQDITCELGATNPTNGLEMLPAHRGRQARVFPTVRPDVPRVSFIWDTKPEPAIFDSLDNLAGRVTRLGHSSSLVSCRLTDGEQAVLGTVFMPDKKGEIQSRCVRQGQLKALESRHKQYGNKPRNLPFTQIRYKRLSSSATAPEIEEKKTKGIKPITTGKWHVYEVTETSQVDSVDLTEITKTLQRTIFSYADELPAGLSGHKPNRQPVEHPHVGFYGLPQIGTKNADGRIIGLVVNIPDLIDDVSRQAAERAIQNWADNAEATGTAQRLDITNRQFILLRAPDETSSMLLRSETWQKPSLRWVSATPIALPRHPGKLTKGQDATKEKAWRKAKNQIVAVCNHIKIPSPVDVQLSFSPFIPGAIPSHSYPQFQQGGIRRVLLHASLTFDVPITGQFVLGAGRHFGLGLMLPIQDNQ